MLRKRFENDSTFMGFIGFSYSTFDTMFTRKYIDLKVLKLKCKIEKQQLIFLLKAKKIFILAYVFFKISQLLWDEKNIYF